MTLKQRVEELEKNMEEVLAILASKQYDKEVKSEKQGKGGMQSKGGKARYAKLSPERRREIAKKAGEARWKKHAEKLVVHGGSLSTEKPNDSTN